MSNFSIVIIAIITFVFVFRICIYFYKKHRYFTLKTREKIIYKLKGFNLQEFLNNEKGLAYEYSVGKFYENLGYKVTFNGIEKGINDGGIDLIAYKKSEKSNHELVLIQCKNYINSNILTQDNVRKFLGDCYLYLHSKNLLHNKNYSFRHIYVLSSDLEANSSILRYERYC